MKSQLIGYFTVAILLLNSMAALAKENQPAQDLSSPDAPSEPLVDVVGVRNPEWKPYQTMLLGLEAFEKDRTPTVSCAAFLAAPAQSKCEYGGSDASSGGKHAIFSCGTRREFRLLLAARPSRS